MMYRLNNIFIKSDSQTKPLNKPPIMSAMASPPVSMGTPTPDNPPSTEKEQTRPLAPPSPMGGGQTRPLTPPMGSKNQDITAPQKPLLVSPGGGGYVSPGGSEDVGLRTRPDLPRNVSSFGQSRSAQPIVITPGAGEYDPQVEAEHRQAIQERVRNAIQGTENYQFKPYSQVLNNSGTHENNIHLGRGSFGQVYVDTTHQTPEGTPKEVVVKTGIMHKEEPHIARKMGELGIGPAVFKHQEGKVPITDPRLKNVMRDYFETRKQGHMPYHPNLHHEVHDFLGIPREQNPLPPHGVIDPKDTGNKNIPDHPTEPRKQNFKDYVDTHKELQHLDPELVETLSESGLYQPDLGLLNAHAVPENRGLKPEHYKLGSKIAMEHLKDYEPVHDFLSPPEAGETLPADKFLSKLKVGIGTLDALHRMNQAGYNHNDLHRANVLHNGDDVRLIDFGVASPISQTSSDWHRYRSYPQKIEKLLQAYKNQIQDPLTGQLPQKYALRHENLLNHLEALDQHVQSTTPNGLQPKINIDPQTHLQHLGKHIHSLKKAYEDLEDHL